MYKSTFFVLFRGLIAAFVVFLSSIALSHADPIKIMSWNIANLGAKPMVALRSGSHARTTEDFAVIRSIIEKADADIIALQEIGSLAAARNVLSEEYDVVLEERCYVAGCAVDHGDIYTAIAWRKSLGFSSANVVQVPELGIRHVPECKFDEPRMVRGGVGIKFERNGVKYTILSVHLKASCADEKSNDPSERPTAVDDCKVLDEQFNFLIRRIKADLRAGRTVVVAGDYNRKMLEANDRYAKKLRVELPGIRIEPQSQSQCWPGNYPQSREFRTSQAHTAFRDVPGDWRWIPYMPSSIGSRDFFLVAGEAANDLVSAEEIFMRPSTLIYNPEDKGLTKQQRLDIEKQAALNGVRFDPPNGYIRACTEESRAPNNLLPEPGPFFGTKNSVLTFSPIHPSDHCPITLELN